MLACVCHSSKSNSLVKRRKKDVFNYQQEPYGREFHSSFISPAVNNNNTNNKSYVIKTKQPLKGDALDINRNMVHKIYEISNVSPDKRVFLKVKENESGGKCGVSFSEDDPSLISAGKLCANNTEGKNLELNNIINNNNNNNFSNCERTIITTRTENRTIVEKVVNVNNIYNKKKMNKKCVYSELEKKAILYIYNTTKNNISKLTETLELKKCEGNERKTLSKRKKKRKSKSKKIEFDLNSECSFSTIEHFSNQHFPLENSPYGAESTFIIDKLIPDGGEVTLSELREMATRATTPDRVSAAASSCTGAEAEVSEAAGRTICAN
ncbi:UNVERIFIED_CONTAM: hypothetical protein RMT77_007985 [Armadillidium vulgare]